jgi:3-oxoacyl-[acyl-carrier-protein] synthase-3
LLHCLPGSKHPVSEGMIAGRQHYMKIKGRDVYKFAVQRFNELIEDAMQKCALSADKIKLIIPHQVNLRIIASAMDKLNLPAEKAFVNIDKYGNTSAASIPIALDEAVRAGKLAKGDVVIFVAFGAGLTWANAVVRM